MKTECIITGVVLVAEGGDVAYNGDLFVQGETFIAHCNEASAHTPDENWYNSMELKWVVPDPEDVWHRNGVWVFPRRTCFMSIAAVNYIDGK